MKGHGRIVHIVAALCIVALLLGLIHFLPLSASTKYQRVLIDLGHVPLFAAIAIAVLYVADIFGGQGRMRPGGYGIAAFAILSIAIGSEAVQSLDPDRSVSFWDSLRNCAGAALGSICFAIATSESRWSPRSQRTSARFGILLVILVLVPPAWTAAAYLHRFNSWPVVIGDNYRLERVFTAAYESELERVPVPSEWQVRRDESAFVLRLRACLNCGILLQELGREWTGLSRLCFDLTNPGEEPLRLSARLGSAPMFFRSGETYEARLTIPAASRANECFELSRFAGRAKTAAGGEFRSGALLGDAASPVTVDVLVHRIWLE